MNRSERAPTADRLAAIGEAILRELPEPFRSAVAHLPIRVSDWADDAILAAMGIEDPRELTGREAGGPIGERRGRAVPP
ncbi:MAG: hypothetical protein AB7X49_27250, partial [Geminicoccaceae bacterium]